MRILCVFNGAIAGGGGRFRVFHHDARFLLELRTRADEVTIAQPLVDVSKAGARGPSGFCNFDLTGHPEIRVSAFPWATGGKLARALHYVRALPWIVRETLRADFVYVFLPGHLPLMFVWAARLFRRPYGVYLRSAPGLALRRVTNALASARFVLATTPQLAERAREFCAASDPVTPMMDLGPEDVVPSPSISETPPWRILFVGRIEEAKGVGELLKGLGELRRRGVSFTLDLAGAGPELDAYRVEATEQGLPDAAFHGMVSDPERLRALFRSADLFVLPTHIEGFPRVLYEAMAHGIPVVTTFVGGIPSIMRDGENCLRIEVGDPAGLSTTVEKALADPGLRRKIAAGGLATVREVLDPARPSHARQVAERLDPGSADT